MSLRPQGSRRAEEKGPAKEEGANLERVERDREREREYDRASAPRAPRVPQVEEWSRDLIRTKNLKGDCSH